jgi:hypothetical protein
MVTQSDFDEYEHVREYVFPDGWDEEEMDDAYRDFSCAEKLDWFEDALVWVGRDLEDRSGDLHKVIGVGPCDPHEACFALVVECSLGGHAICSSQMKLPRGKKTNLKLR